jgi:hypothetical protein
VAPSPLPPDPTAALGGQIVFTSQTASGILLEPPPLTDEEVGHMHGLLAQVRATPRGRELHDIFGQVRRELGYLVRNCRPVKVAWHRRNGPAFMALALNHLAGHSPTVPHEVRGVTRRDLLERMRAVLAVHGSTPLREALDEHGDELVEALTTADTARDCIALLRQKAPA